MSDIENSNFFVTYKKYSHINLEMVSNVAVSYWD